MTTSPSARLHQSTSAVLASPGLIRLISEIDDHGAIPERGLARTLGDLSTHQIRQATEHADILGLLDRSYAGLGLTTAGQDLADVYDATARWARRHDYPAPVGDFAGRIRHTFALLHKPTPTEPRSADNEADPELAHVRELLTQWGDTHQPQQDRGAYGVAA
ncbi:hypothetical protein PUR57_01480 [Streptomyces sp. JV176]|uniref:hypothetical protein n=1 Tax=Streptomyces sp. JV176 TaxID=858630 RepID=UPI002E7740E9|nr:hypothetical protein [Streptomyces sp. JV176]MEE1797371.1 hypothetical protein [Streptomyces sp. JV176]